MKLVCLMVMLVICLAGVQATGLLYPHMLNNGDQLGPQRNDQSYRIHLKFPFQFWGKAKDTIHIYENGVIAFKAQFRTFIPAPLPFADKPLMLAYWADHNIKESNPGAHIWWRETKDADILSRATDDVRAAFSCSSDFKAKGAVIVTFQRVESFEGFDCDDDDKRDVQEVMSRRRVSDDDAAARSSHCDTTAGSNSYQIVLINGGPDKEMFAMFNYHTLEWSEGYTGETTISGFNKGDGQFVLFPYQGLNLALFSNVGKTGRYMYKVDGKPMGPAEACP